MDIPSATHLILTAGMLSAGNEIFILKMPAIRIMDLAEAMRKTQAPHYGLNPENIEIKIIGVRSGEKIDEQLVTPDETTCAFENDEMIIVMPRSLPYTDYSPHLEIPEGFQIVKRGKYSSKDARLLTGDEIVTLLNKLTLSIIPKGS